MPQLRFDPRIVPSSSPAAWLALTGPTPTAKTPPGLYLRSCHAALDGEAFRIEVVRADGSAISPQCAADAGGVEGLTDGIRFHAAWTDDGGCRLRVSGGSLRLTMQHLDGFAPVIAQLDARRVQAVIPALNRQFAFTALRGSWRLDAPWRTDRCIGGVIELVAGADGVVELVVRDTRSSWPAADAEPPIESLVERRRAEFAAFAAALPMPAGNDADAHTLACYLLWSCLAPPRGRVLRPTVLMSKAWMNRVWSWDHCFNALALAPGHADLAWHQVMTFADHQDADGCFLDCFNPGSEIWEFVKPPVHGWCVQRLMEWADPGSARLREFYEPLARWTRWWLNVRDHAYLGLPCAHHGNDTGADNSTLFDLGVPLATPDLAAYLVLQLDALGDLAARLGRRWDERQWREQAAQVRAAHLRHHWADGDPAPLAADGTRLAQRGDACQPWLAGVLGERLPSAQQARLLAALPRFRCPAGIASERLGSPQHVRDGYWRGPSWAPWNLLLCDGLRRMGRGDVARGIIDDVLATGAAHGFAENFAADDGAPLRDRAYTWTASVHLVLERMRGGLG